MKKPRVIIFSGYGLNCENETQVAFETAGAKADIVHIATIIERPTLLQKYQIIAFPGGFSYGDDTGSGKAYGRRVARHLGDHLRRFLARDTLIIGICNGFQILTNTGLLPGALVQNDNARFLCRWVDLQVSSPSPWLNGLATLSLPIAHGEGKYFDTEDNLNLLEQTGGVALRYVTGEMTNHFSLPANPNGSSRNIAGITANEGRVFGLMPHPERGSFFTQLPHWTWLQQNSSTNKKAFPKYATGIQIFRNAVSSFK